MTVLLVLQIIVVIALIGVILVQKSSSDGFTGGSSPNSFLTGRASANLLTRTTSILATIFILNSLVLAYLASHADRGASVLDEAASEVHGTKETTSVPAADTKIEEKKEEKTPLEVSEDNVTPEATDAKTSTDKVEEAAQPTEAEEKSPVVPTAE